MVTDDIVSLITVLSQDRLLTQTIGHAPNLLNAKAQDINAQAYALDQRRAEREDVSYLRDRFTTAAGQLGHDADPVRLAGVYAMAALADDWLRQNNQHEAQVCVDVLCGYVRTRRDYSDSEVKKQADTEIRQTIVRTITNHLQSDQRRGDLPSWSPLDLDFTGSHFDGTYSFGDARFSDGGLVFFGDARFSDGGLVFFVDARFSGGRVSFVDARFSGGRVSFVDARFSGGQVSFVDARFSDGQVSFVDARFSGGQVLFSRALFAAPVSGPWGWLCPPPMWPMRLLQAPAPDSPRNDHQ